MANAKYTSTPSTSSHAASCQIHQNLQYGPGDPSDHSELCRRMNRWLSPIIVDIENPRVWWIQHQKDYPQLSKVALDILTIPAMGSEVEGVFSSTGLMVTDRRNRLEEDIIEAVESMKSWRTGVLAYWRWNSCIQGVWASSSYVGSTWGERDSW